MADSAEIVASIQRRIASGELKPGDRVPSTRQITKRWGVAMATATRVLTTLQQDGLVVARPGIGTVVASGPPAPAPRPRHVPPEIDRADVIRTAMGIADAEGSPAVSMRRVATELGVATMSLYRHVTGKDDLLERMVDTAFGDHRLTSPSPDDWQEALETGARTLWRIFRRHPWAAQVMSLTRPQLTPHALAYTEWVLSALDKAGVAPRHMFQVHLTVFSYVRGLAVSLEPEAVAEQETGLTYSEFVDTQDAAFTELVTSGAYPAFQVIAAGADFDLDLDEQFEFGLRHLLAGLAGLPVGERQARLR
ncbi:TetR/AcrR family transcriptional regulator C-terminal domain-containing protein [Actinophytocola algeriensis]|uniref:AcrR family transcriptional regulator n=1 Tax=Actinophytocola algeriensis TaxID=1768010 RepID=A0A7W7QCU5_9PSEU|nr:TetR/AcrR family transcriptional regulator C-terminal domain-containing protein [Actinophytocola algeriensis]MBB4911148.1 AcrR family transcriptional regulator [Actinophytocola algeriensis]MBE1479087.1 AcrR family transcriptional regulator [Actinophytocola algeriensis]